MLFTDASPALPPQTDESTPVAPGSLVVDVETRVRRSTHDRIRNLSVVDREGRFVVCGEVSSQHMRQLALLGALEVLTGDQFASRIVVSTSTRRSVAGV